MQAAALDLLASSAPERALAPAVERVDAPDQTVRSAAGRALGVIGSPAIGHVLEALRDPETVAVGIEAARRMEPDGAADVVHTFVRSAADQAKTDRALIASTPQDPDLEALLRTAILERARVAARSALWAASMVAADREAARTAIERLDGSGSVRASALEALEAADATKSVGPLLALWEPIPTAHDDESWLTTALEDEDDLVRRCAEVVRSRREGDTMTLSIATVSVVERVLILRGIPLFADLSPGDLERLALIAEEQGYDDGETIAREGELGDAMHIVTEGVIRVVSGSVGDERMIARRTAGEVVGEMSIITRNPRIASLDRGRARANDPDRSPRVREHGARAPRSRARRHAGARAEARRERSSGRARPARSVGRAFLRPLRSCSPGYQPVDADVGAVVERPVRTNLDGEDRAGGSTEHVDPHHPLPIG